MEGIVGAEFGPFVVGVEAMRHWRDWSEGEESDHARRKHVEGRSKGRQ